MSDLELIEQERQRLDDTIPFNHADAVELDRLLSKFIRDCPGATLMIGLAAKFRLPLRRRWRSNARKPPRG